MKKGAKRLAIHHRVRHHIHKFHKIRKLKEENLPPWKEAWHKFNDAKLGWLEHIIDKSIPWLVLALLAIILGEFSDTLNFFNWHWMEVVAEFFHEHEATVKVIDQTIIGFFVADLYFNFFKKAKISTWLKTSILDIIAVAPLGLILRVSGLGEAQSVLHVTADIEKEAAKLLREEEAAVKLFRTEQEAAKLAKLQRVQKIQKATKVAARSPRFLRLYRLSQFFKKKK